jgi:hypothetical protein
MIIIPIKRMQTSGIIIRVSFKGGFVIELMSKKSITKCLFLFTLMAAPVNATQKSRYLPTSSDHIIGKLKTYRLSTWSVITIVNPIKRITPHNSWIFCK